MSKNPLNFQKILCQHFISLNLNSIKLQYHLNLNFHSLKWFSDNITHSRPNSFSISISSPCLLLAPRLSREIDTHNSLPKCNKSNRNNTINYSIAKKTTQPSLSVTIIFHDQQLAVILPSPPPPRPFGLSKYQFDELNWKTKSSAKSRQFSLHSCSLFTHFIFTLRLSPRHYTLHLLTDISSLFLIISLTSSSLN